MREKINNNQKKIIHIAASQLGMDDSTYREMLFSMAGVRSSTELSPGGFARVMDHLKSRGFKKTIGRHECSGYMTYKQKWEGIFGTDERPGYLVTPSQLARIETDWDHMKWYWTKPVESKEDRDQGKVFGNRGLALRGFLKKRFGASDLRFLSFSQAHKCIEALKAIQERHKG